MSSWNRVWVSPNVHSCLRDNIPLTCWGGPLPQGWTDMDYTVGSHEWGDGLHLRWNGSKIRSKWLSSVNLPAVIEPNDGWERGGVTTEQSPFPVVVNLSSGFVMNTKKSVFLCVWGVKLFVGMLMQFWAFSWWLRSEVQSIRRDQQRLECVSCLWVICSPRDACLFQQTSPVTTPPA